MPLPRACRLPGCPHPALRGGRCATHAATHRHAERRHYTGICGLNYGRRWRNAREWFLQRHPLCVDCQGAGLVTAATDVDHIIPHDGNYERFWDASNWQALCHAHHSRKTAREVGFGS